MAEWEPWQKSGTGGWVENKVFQLHACKFSTEGQIHVEVVLSQRETLQRNVSLLAGEPPNLSQCNTTQHNTTRQHNTIQQQKTTHLRCISIKCIKMGASSLQACSSCHHAMISLVYLFFISTADHTKNEGHIWTNGPTGQFIGSPLVHPEEKNVSVSGSFSWWGGLEFGVSFGDAAKIFFLFSNFIFGFMLNSLQRHVFVPGFRNIVLCKTQVSL